MDRRTLLGTLAAGALGVGLHARNLEPRILEYKPASNPLADYVPRTFDFSPGLPGLSQDLLADHLVLYRGYVTRTNALLKDVLAAEKEGRTGAAVQELRRRLGFEFSGMRLHEDYFEALSPRAARPSATHPLQAAIAETWGSFDTWWAAFKATCLMPGIGWGALVMDLTTSRLMNAWFQDHENAVAVGTQALLVVDVWEHAYLKDHGAAGRGKYVDALKPLIDWRVIEKRF